MKLFGRKRKASRGLPNYWNESVIERIQRNADVDRETARTWFNEMLVFLDMVADSKRFISPPEAIDVAWHAFILHTRDYEDYCRERFGRVIHHQPTGAPDPDAYRRAYQQRSSTGGPVDNSVWVIPAAAVGGVAATEGIAAAEGGHDVGPALQDTGPGDGGGGGFFSNLFGGDSGGGGSGDSGGGSGDSGGGGSSCGGGGCGGGGG
jgi:hypothetical protein